MGRRIQGFIQRRKYNDQRPKTTEKAGRQETAQVKECKGETLPDDGMRNIVQARWGSGIVSDPAEASEKPRKRQDKQPDTEIIDNLINMLAARIKERPDINNRLPDNGQRENKQGQSGQNELQALVAKLLLSSSDDDTAANPILAAHDKAIRQSNAQNNTKNRQLPQQKAETAAAASQVLAEAQYELSKELEASLQKLRQVIEESNQVAQKINNILERNNGDNKGNNQHN